MDLGTGIFLSTALLAIVLLYGFTKDRWRWRKIIVRALFSGLLLLVGSAAVVTLAHYWDELFPPQLGRQTQYAGLKLGMSPQEVMYIKGYPPVVLDDDTPGSKWRISIKTEKLENGKKVTDFKRWSYEQYKSDLTVEFNNERTTVVAIRCYSEDKTARCPPIGSVKDGTGEQDAYRKLGGPAEQRIDGVTKDLRDAVAHAGAGLHACDIRSRSPLIEMTFMRPPLSFWKIARSDAWCCLIGKRRSDDQWHSNSNTSIRKLSIDTLENTRQSATRTFLPRYSTKFLAI